MNGRTSPQLLFLLTKQFDMSELRTLAHGLGIDHEILSGGNKPTLLSRHYLC